MCLEKVGPSSPVSAGTMCLETAKAETSNSESVRPLVLLVLCQTGYSIMMGFAVKTSYIKTTTVITQETLKLLLSVAMLTLEKRGDVGQVWLTLRRNFWSKSLGKLALPAFLYAIANSLTVYIVYFLTPATYQVLSQLKIVAAAFFSRVLLRRTLSLNKMVSIGLLLVGVIIVQTSQANTSVLPESMGYQKKTLGILFACVQAMISGFCGTYLEIVFKRNCIDLNKGEVVGDSMLMKNVQLAFISILVGIGTVIVNGDLNQVLSDGFFHGYEGSVWMASSLAAIGGIANGAVMKSNGNIAKNFAVSIAMILTACLSVYFFDFVLSIATFYGAILVVTATLQYVGAVHLIDFQQVPQRTAMLNGLAVVGIAATIGFVIRLTI